MYPVYFDLQVNTTLVNRRIDARTQTMAVSLSLSFSLCLCPLLFSFRLAQNGNVGKWRICQVEALWNFFDVQSWPADSLAWLAFDTSFVCWCSASKPHQTTETLLPWQIWSQDDLNIWGLPQQSLPASWVLASLRPSFWTFWTWTQMCCKCVANVLHPHVFIR